MCACQNFRDQRIKCHDSAATKADVDPDCKFFSNNLIRFSMTRIIAFQ